MAGRIEDYALIGDCETAALVGLDGSIDWLCWPRFDSDACFAALLGDPANGRWKIAPAADGVRTSWRYRPDSLILETRHQTDEGVVLVTDFMPPRGAASDLVRLVTGLHGRVDMNCELILRFGYGRTLPWVTRLDDGGLSAVAGPDRVVLRTPIKLAPNDMTTVADFTVRAGESIPFVLAYGLSHLPPPAAIDAAAALAEAEAFWREWAARGDVTGPHSDAIRRSLITLKALTHAPTGGVVAAPTTSLPERIGGQRNWDYRFCWVRDATLTLLALMNAGYLEEAAAWRDWLLRAVAGSPDQMQIMYGLAGERRLTEWTADWLPGYEGSRPVRIGNAAHDQFQLDVYGELMDALHQGRKGGLPGSEPAWAVQRGLLRHVEATWDTPDEGLWEVRGGRKHFTFSKVMAWVALDRGVRSAEQFGLDGDLDRWRSLRARMHESICAHGYDAERNTFVQAYGRPELDASLLLLAEVGFLAADDPRFRGTVEAVERNLLRDGFLLRYDTQTAQDGLPPGEGAFLACSFWLVDAWLMLGRRDDAEALFARLLAVRNDLGLYAEEYDPKAGRMCGNFPQAFSHVGLINSAYNLTRAAKPVQQRAETESTRPAVVSPA
ncbi:MULTISPECIES: glycoside hydrolase family 15 protein [unclassified Phenylobacterium]|uniref:glycoside hydrolase family 15 protein n=1 Tax=unclassified Phenylobacterium TaxID=2640670 RepID=UPI00083B1AC4|nr:MULTISPECIES: glycoside hydrolase family 15 protein [unclassified Phenylobacterium]